MFITSYTFLREKKTVYTQVRFIRDQIIFICKNIGVSFTITRTILTRRMRGTWRLPWLFITSYTFLRAKKTVYTQVGFFGDQINLETLAFYKC